MTPVVTTVIREASKQAYEDGMARAFQACHASLSETGRLSCFCAQASGCMGNAGGGNYSGRVRCDGSWPIQTEQASRTRAISSAALASSVWLVCRKRDSLAKVGWDNRVMGEMRENICRAVARILGRRYSRTGLRFGPQPARPWRLIANILRSRRRIKNNTRN